MDNEQLSAIKVESLHKVFKLPHEKQNSIKSALINVFSTSRSYEKQHVLRDISLDIKAGEFFGIVGRNGSGKSTLLKLLAGIYTPTKGHVRVNGKLTPFIELGVGFNPELTGRENIYLNGALLGFNRKQVAEMYDDIVAFAELEKFMDQKLKNYSSGMQVRLAFSIATRAKSDILLIDEVLAVGDAGFQKKCYDYFMQLKKDKVTVILVTHDMNAVRQYCDRAAMISEGEILQVGSPDEVAQSYQRLFTDSAANEKVTKQKSKKADRWGNGNLLVKKAKVEISETTVKLRATYKAHQNLEPPVLGFSIHDGSGQNILEGNTLRQPAKVPSLKKGNELTIEWSFPNVFRTGQYNVNIAACDQSTTNYYDWYNSATSFDIVKRHATAGVVDPHIIVKECGVNGK